MLAELGLAVVREIPVQTLAGLVSGAYTLHGGVVRDAGGRIVAHLLTSGPADLIKATIPGLNVLSSLVGSGQLYSLSRDVEELRGVVESVMTVASAGAALSGIGLIANVAGTAFLSRKLDSVQTQLARIERLLNDQHLSVLRGAVDNLRHAEHAADMETRKAMLVSAKTDFSKSAHFYGSQFADSRSLQEVLALEDSFGLAVVGSALCLSELGMYGAAAQISRATTTGGGLWRRSTFSKISSATLPIGSWPMQAWRMCRQQTLSPLSISSTQLGSRGPGSMNLDGRGPLYGWRFRRGPPKTRHSGRRREWLRSSGPKMARFPHSANTSASWIRRD